MSKIVPAITSLESYLSLVEQLPFGILLIDHDGVVKLVNHAAETILRRKRSKLLDSSFGFPICDQEVSHIDLVSQIGEFIKVEMKVSTIDIEGQSYYLTILRNLGSTNQLWYGCALPPREDPLTGLLTRFYFDEELRNFVRYLKKQHTVALCIVDFSNISEINETLGRRMGDQLLQMTADRLCNHSDCGEMIGRLSGREFVFSYVRDENLEELEQAINDILKTLHEPFNIDGKDIFVGFTCGVSLYPEHTDNIENLYRFADIALHESKRQNKWYTIFSNEIESQTKYDILILNSLHTAIKEGQLRLQYQPIVSLRTGHITGAEALVRWHHPEEGIMSPERFIPVAEASGKISEIDSWVCNEVCRQIKAWEAEGIPVVPVSVNASLQEIDGTDFSDHIKAICEHHKLPSGMLNIEITETILSGNRECILNNIHGLKQEKVGIYMDDFGTGYSNLAQLNLLPFDRLKIDRSFIMNLVSDKDNASLVITIIAMSKNLGVKVVAEGVENPTQMGFLQKHGCDYIQGYHFSRPLDPDDFAALLYHDKSIDIETNQNRTLLIVDDEIALLDSMKRMLRSDPYRVLTASSAYEAFEILALEQVDVVITDFLMPNVNGAQLLKQLHQQYPWIIGILLTGHTGIESAIEAVNSGGVFRFLTKPCPPDILRNVILDAFNEQERVSTSYA